MKITRLKGLAALSGLGFLLAAVPTQAATFTESDDAGESLQTAAAVTSAQSMSLKSISGSLSGDADLFKIFLTGGQTFSATTNSSETADIPVNQAAGIPIEVVINPKIFLFDELGNGVYANDDLFGSAQSTLLSGPPGFSPTASGIYFLGITGLDNFGAGLDAFSANGQIFPSDPFDQIVGPTGPGGESPLTGFVGDRAAASSGKYTISLTGAQTIAAAPTDPAASVPEPAMTLGLLMVGGLIISQAKQSTRKQTS